jgi:GT2 family glycosyltransferase
MSPLYVITLNWNLPDDTITCVESVRHAIRRLHGRIEIVVVDNGSTDDSVLRFHRVFGNSIHLVENSQNLGFAGGMNAGIRYALQHNAGAVLLLNNDTSLEPQSIHYLIATASSQPSAGLVGPVIYYYDEPEKIWRFGDDEHPWLPIPLKLSPARLASARGAPFAVDYITGCCMLVRREVFEQVGLFDERYFMYFEDADFCRRVRDAGFTIWCAPPAKIWHKVSVSAGKDRPLNRYARLWGAVQFYRKHPHGRLPAMIHLYIWLKLLVITLQDLRRGEWMLIRRSWQAIRDSYGNRNQLSSWRAKP